MEIEIPVCKGPVRWSEIWLKLNYCERKTLFRLKKEAKQAIFKTSERGQSWEIVNGFPNLVLLIIVVKKIQERLLLSMIEAEKFEFELFELLKAVYSMLIISE